MVVGVTMVRDEADIVGETVRLMLDEVDYVIVADNGSVDGTRQILEEIAADIGRVEIHDDLEVGYYQSTKMSALAARAAEIGADWVVPFDADERWLARSGGRVADALMALPDAVLVAQADLWDHVATGEDPDVPNPLERMQWRRRDPAPLPKVAVRPVSDVVIHQGNHGATFPGVDLPATVTNLLTVRHYPLRSPEQMVRKARNGAEAYAATDLPADVGGHWRGWGTLSDDQLAEVFEVFYFRADPAVPLELDGETQPPLVYDPCPR